MAYRKGNPRHQHGSATEYGHDKAASNTGAASSSVSQFAPFSLSKDILNEPPVSSSTSSRSSGSSNPRHRTRPSAANHKRATARSASLGENSERDTRTTADRFSQSIRHDSEALAAVRKKRKRKKILIGVLSAVLILILGTGAAAFAYISNINRNLQDGVDDDLLAMLSTVDKPEDPFYALLLGIDGSIEREKDMGTNFRSDSMMLARIDPKKAQITLVSIPRDLKIDNLDGHGPQKINAAHAFGGPALSVKTVSELAGVPIAHYAEINFDGFKEAVDVLGGVEVDVPIEIDDPQAGGHLDAGVQTLNGDQALILCRSRHSYDNYGSGDDYRAANQRMVLSAIAQKLLASDPVTMANTISAMSEYVLTDMDVASIIAVAQSMSGMTADSIYSAKAPATSEYVNNVWWDILDEDAWEEMMARVDAGLPPVEEEVIDPLTGTILSTAGGSAYADSLNSVHAANRSEEIGLRNGNGIDGTCTKAQEILEKMGYRKINSRNADSFDYEKTVIVYKGTSDKQDAELIAQQLGVDAPIPDNDVYLFDEDILVVLGKDFS
ncbi:LCP family protein [Adlercreutzia sp. ZJ304]|uniref:LCP family protein n=1 Tax=Adlercreutzia sp. ZJ304 TaxID=2709791 RepID=UPI0013EC1B24|nr:LCP family protein [Adlercreutzia sp. ZJ304]